MPKDNPWQWVAEANARYRGEIMPEKLDAPAVKYDNDKVRFDLLPPNAIVELGHVYTMGARKYADRNWEKGMAYGRLFAACMRHLFCFWLGEDKDPESGLHHLAHAAFSCLAIVEYSYTGKGIDDRPCR